VETASLEGYYRLSADQEHIAISMSVLYILHKSSFVPDTFVELPKGGCHAVSKEATKCGVSLQVSCVTTGVTTQLISACRAVD
jgi:hypothetical protein